MFEQPSQPDTPEDGFGPSDFEGIFDQPENTGVARVADSTEIVLLQRELRDAQRELESRESTANRYGGNDPVIKERFEPVLQEARDEVARLTKKLRALEEGASGAIGGEDGIAA